MNENPILIIEDDEDDRDLLKIVLAELGLKNKLVFFHDARLALAYLEEEPIQPFIILCDFNMPVMSGLDLKKAIDRNERLKKKSIPFIFYSTSTDQTSVNKAYTETTVQGFFVKEPSMEKIKQTLSLIIQYWYVCKHPNNWLLNPTP